MTRKKRGFFAYFYVRYSRTSEKISLVHVSLFIAVAKKENDNIGSE